MPEEKTSEQFQAELDIANNKVSDLTKQLAAKNAELDKVTEVNESLGLEIEKLTSKTPASAPIKAKKLVLTDYSFEYEGKTYAFRYPVQMFNKVRITPVEVVADASLQKQLIDAKNAMVYVK